ncbi:MAG: hypothetical protein JNK82_04915 [Myxococcaceae bacterium]|nr:hypothetical protein [Myxococcaceae bacterium]
MRHVLVVAAVTLTCTGLPAAPDGGGTAGGGNTATAGGGSGGAGGGADAGCIPLPGCPCDGAGGGAIFYSDRLVIASRASADAGASVQVWNFISALTPDERGTAQPLLTGVPVALVGGFGAPPSHSVFALKEGTTAAQTWNGNLVPGCDRPTDVPAVSAGAGRADQAAGALWYVRSPGDVARVTRPTDPAPRNTVFASAGAPLVDFAYDRSGDRLYAAGTSGIYVWPDAGTRDGGAPDFQLTAEPASQLALAGSRLLGSARTGTLAVWNDIAATTAARPFDFSLDAGEATAIQHHTLGGGGLFVTVQPTPTSGRVLVYRGFASTTADRPPDLVIDHPSLTGAREAVLTDGRFGVADSGVLVVLTATGASIFRDPFGSPSFAAEVSVAPAAPVDLLYLP